MLERDHWGRTLLHWAVLNGDVDGVTDLLRVPGIMEVEDNDGHTALSLAVKYKEMEILENLFERGARMSDRVIDEARRSQHAKIILDYFKPQRLKNNNPKIIAPQPIYPETLYAIDILRSNSKATY